MPANASVLTVIATIDGPLVRVSSDLFEINISVEGKATAQPRTRNFALWLSLPIAMAAARDLHISGSVSPAALANAQALVDIWSRWLPALFHPIRISAAEIICPGNDPSFGHDLMLYSGGVDSTYSLLKNYINTSTPVSLLTIHGMDYQTTDQNRFEKLKNKIKPLTTQIRGKHYFIKSNAADVMSKFGINGGIGHGFHLFGNLFLFEDDYTCGAIAADCTPTLDFIISPWGTNHLTNPMFSSERFHIKTLDSDIDRAEKVGKLLALDGKEHALAALTFCKNRQSRPENCGMCSKCIRTKAMFYTETGAIPDIFAERSFKPTDLAEIDLSRRGERALVLDLLASARRNDKAREFEWLEKQIKRKPKPKSKPRLKKLLKKLPF